MQKEILYRFFEGNCTPDEENKIRLWMEASSENEVEFFKERKLFDALILLPSGDKKTKRSLGYLSIGSKVKTWINIAAAVLITLSLTLIYQHISVKDQLLAMQTIRVPVGQRVNLILSDGTRVWLNSRTSMSYPISFGLKTREVKIDGEAFFNVAHDLQKPFIVHTSHCDLEVFGTKFNVEDYSNKDSFVASLLEGSIKVSKSVDKSKSMILIPGQMVTLNGDSMEKMKIVDYDHYRWREGLICFKDMPFPAVIKNLESCFGIKIVIENQDILSTSFTGKFRQIDGVNYALTVLQKNLHFDFYRDEDKCIYIK